MTMLSVVVPSYNREAFLPRCLSSLLTQDHPQFEVIVVDDASTDGSAACLQAIDDPRLKVLRHAGNRGVGAARNTGVSAARGRWIVFVDSDDELLPGALHCIQERADLAPPELHALWFRCRLDCGRLSPDPVPRAIDWDYFGYLRFIEETAFRCRDMLRCVRRECFDGLRYSEQRMHEAQYHLDFARRFNSRLYADVLRLYHQDASDRLAPQVRSLERPRLPRSALEILTLKDAAQGYDGLLRDHGEALRRYAPTMYRNYLRRAAAAALSVGEHRGAWRHVRTLLAHAPFSSRSWCLLWTTLAVARA